MVNLEEIWLPVNVVARLEGIANCTVTRRAAAGNYSARREERDRRGSYLIQLASLSLVARTAYLLEEAKRRGSLYEQEAAAKTRTAEKTTPAESAPIQERLSSAEAATIETLWASWEAATESAQNKASWRVAVLVEWQELQRSGIPKQQATEEIQRRHDVGKSALYEWQALIAGQDDQAIWPPLLLAKPRPDANAAFSDAAWQYILEQWGTQNRPKLAAVYRRAQDKAAQNGWDLPSFATVRRRLQALPAADVLYMREGPNAVSDFYPHQQRNRAAQALHDVWCVDGHKADVFVRFPNGKIDRPVLVGFQDERSRVLLGYAIGESETSLLTRNAFMKSIEQAQAMPRHVRPDNGRAFASKFMSGGVKNRFRFKVKEEELEGIWTVLGIKVIWAQPYAGRSKIIESFWRVVAENVCKRPEFIGAYTGNKPDARPEEWDKNKAVDLAVFEAALEEELARYHHKIHRGDGMGASPYAVYSELLASTPVLRKPNTSQMRMLMLYAQSIKLSQTHTIDLLGNRYYTEALSLLPLRSSVDVRFDSNDLSKPVYVYHRGRYLCEAPPLGKVGVHDKDAAEAQSKARARLRKSTKDRIQAQEHFRDSFAPNLSPLPKPNMPTTGPNLPAPSIVTLNSTPTLETPPPVDLAAQEEKDQIEKQFAELRRKKIAAMKNGTW